MKENTPVQKRKKNRVKQPVYSTGTLAVNLFGTLSSDFRREGLTISPRPSNWLSDGNLTAFREWSFVEALNLEPKQFKMARQLNNFLSKYTFQNDAISKEQRQSETLIAWNEDNVRIAKCMQPDFPTVMVLREARAIVKRILGDLPKFDDIASFAKVGTRATRSCSRADAGLDIYLSNPAAFSTSSQCLEWVVETLLPADTLLQDLWKFVSVTDTRSIESVVLTLVPKKWSKDRPITPLQLANLMYSYVYGRFIEIRLALAGLNISNLQSRHQSMIKNFSRTLQYATVDLKGGSNNITKQHMLYLLQRPWFNVIKRCLTHDVLLNGDTLTRTESVLPMGNALTFPIETLFFYSVVEAIRNLLGVKGFSSCYGDDLIYPSRIHGYVVHVFKQLNWAMNLDKTFVNVHFRESCGEDFFHGVAVRPYFFPDVPSFVGKTKYRCLLYQIYNGLCERWDSKCISRTLRFLMVEIAMHGDVYRVPTDYPDYSGIKTPRPFVKVDGMMPFASIKCDWCPDIQNFRWTFSCLSERAVTRVGVSNVPVYWDALRQAEAVTSSRILSGLAPIDPLAFLDFPEVSNLRWKGFKRKVKVKGKVVREYKVYKVLMPTGKTKTLDDLSQTFYWSEEIRWLGTAGYTAA